MKYPERIFPLIIPFLLASTVPAAGGGTTAVDFLRMGVSARSAATGEAFSAVSDGPVSTYYNPAGLSRTENFQIAGMHSEWFQDLRYEYLGLALPVGRRGGVGVSFSYLTFGSIRGFSETDEPLGDVSAYDMAAALSYGHRLTDGLSLGLGVKTVGEKLDNVEAFGFAADIGIQFRMNRFLTGLSVTNMGPSMKYETSSSPLPTTVNAGISYYPLGSSLAFLIGTQIPFEGEASFGAGLEYSYNNLMVLRGGYSTESDLGGGSGLSFGGGINLSSHSLDYAYKFNGIMGATHQISFIFRFGQPREQVSASLARDDGPEARDEAEPDVERQVETARRYLVCAGRHSDRPGAERHVEALTKFGLSPWIVEKGEDQFLVVLQETDNSKKAEKLKSKYEDKGIKCIVEVF
jgi:hypothetical protein